MMANIISNIQNQYNIIHKHKKVTTIFNMRCKMRVVDCVRGTDTKVVLGLKVNGWVNENQGGYMNLHIDYICAKLAAKCWGFCKVAPPLKLNFTSFTADWCTIPLFFCSFHLLLNADDNDHLIQTPHEYKQFISDCLENDWFFLDASSINFNMVQLPQVRPQIRSSTPREANCDDWIWAFVWCIASSWQSNDADRKTNYEINPCGVKLLNALEVGVFFHSCSLSRVV